MKTLFKFLLTALVAVVLSSCGPSKPQMFGIDQVKFQAMNAQQQRAQINTYNADQAEKLRACTVFNLLGTAAGAAIGPQKIAGSSSSHCNASHTSCSSSSSSASVGFG